MTKSETSTVDAASIMDEEAAFLKAQEERIELSARRTVASVRGKGWSAELASQLIATAPPGAPIPQQIRKSIHGEKQHEQKRP